MEVLEHVVIFLIFLMALRYVFQVFLPKKDSGGCSKGCGKACVVSNFEQNLEKLEKTL